MTGEYAGEVGPGRWRKAGHALAARLDGVGQPTRTATAYPPSLEGLIGSRWLALAAEMAGLANSAWPPGPGLTAPELAAPEPLAPKPPVPESPGSRLAAIGPARLPRVATRTLGADVASVRVGRDFTIATLHRWGQAERSQDIAIVVSELLTNALRHGLPGTGDHGSRRPIWFGLLQPGSCVLCAVADPSRSAPVLQSRGSLAETGRGLHIICELSDQWGFALSDSGKVVWAMFRPWLAPEPCDPATTSEPDRALISSCHRPRTLVRRRRPGPRRGRRRGGRRAAERGLLLDQRARCAG